MSAPLSLRLYRGASRLAGPALRLLLARRAARGKEDPARLAERYGGGEDVRPDGPVLWLHGASVGEALALLALLDAVRAARPGLGGVLTTGTLASARLVAPRLPPGFVHRFAPLDVVPWVARFIDRWQPDLAVRIDSEIWPATLSLLAERGVATVLVNARLSEGSAQRWARLPGLARHLLRGFTAIAAQDVETRDRLAALGADPSALGVGGALKAAVAPPAADAAVLRGLRDAIGSRPVWLAASTHPPEEGLALDAHARAAPSRPGLLTLIAPRHPDRGEAVAAEAAARGLRVERRSAGQGPEGAEVYVADTLGEMGLWYRLAPFAFVGGSVAPMGGHNPYEPAALGVALAAGPSTQNFAEAYRALAAADALCAVGDGAALGQALLDALTPEGALTPAAAAAAGRGRVALATDPGPLAAATALVLRHLPA